MAGLIQSFESTYLKQHAIVQDQNLLKFLNHKKEEKILEATLVYSKYIDDSMKSFMKSVYSGRTIKPEGRDHIFDLLHT